MGNRVNQSTVPTFNDDTSIISNMDNATILFCDSFSGNRRNFIVVDKASIVANGDTTVDTAYTNGWIEDFPGNSKNRRYYKWVIDGSDVNVFDNFCLYQDVLNDVTKFYMTENGTPFSDWNLMQRRQIKGGGEGKYASHLEFNNGYDNTATYELHYWEDINEVNAYSLNMNREGGGIARNRLIPTTMKDQSGVGYYLSDAVVSDRFNTKCTYKDFLSVAADLIIDKRFSDNISIKQFEYGYDMAGSSTPCSFEIWTGDRNKVGARRENVGNDYSDKRFGSTSMLVHSSHFNSYSIDSLGPGVYKFRIRYVDGTYSNWLEDSLEIRKLNVFSTDITVSSKKYEGLVYLSKIK